MADEIHPTVRLQRQARKAAGCHGYFRRNVRRGLIAALAPLYHTGCRAVMSSASIPHVLDDGGRRIRATLRAQQTYPVVARAHTGWPQDRHDNESDSESLLLCSQQPSNPAQARLACLRTWRGRQSVAGARVAATNGQRPSLCPHLLAA